MKTRARCRVCYFDKYFAGPCCDDCKALGFPKKRKRVLSELQRFDRAKWIGHFLNEFCVDHVIAGNSDNKEQDEFLRECLDDYIFRNDTSEDLKPSKKKTKKKR